MKIRPSVRPFGVFALILVMISVSAAPAAERNAVRGRASFCPFNNNPIAKQAFDDFYNQDYDRAIRGFESLAKEHPDDPFATNYLLSAVLFKEMYRIGALDTESYANDSFMDRKASRPLDPAARARILELETAPKSRPIDCSPRIRTMSTPFTPGVLPVLCAAPSWAWAKKPGSAG